jgi:hypothetical protein
MLVLENTCNSFQNLYLKTHLMHTCNIRTKPTITHYRVCLRFPHSYMKQFLSLFMFKWPNHSKHNIHLSMLKRKSPNPSSNPNTPTHTIYQKHCCNIYLKAHPKNSTSNYRFVLVHSLKQTNFAIHLYIIVRIT